MSGVPVGEVVAAIVALGGAAGFATLLRVRSQNKVDLSEAEEAGEKGPYERLAALADRYEKRILKLEERADSSETREALCQETLAELRERIALMETQNESRRKSTVTRKATARKIATAEAAEVRQNARRGG